MACYGDSFTLLILNDSVQNLLSSCLLSKNVRIRIYKTNFACGSVWVWALDSGIKLGTQAEGVWDRGADEKICTEEIWGDGKVD
jgi:hypothetical protein